MAVVECLHGTVTRQGGETVRLGVYEDITDLTPLNPFERSGDGRPRVPDDLLETCVVDEALETGDEPVFASWF